VQGDCHRVKIHSCRGKEVLRRISFKKLRTPISRISILGKDVCDSTEKAQEHM
jgi:hypothetical protein